MARRRNLSIRHIPPDDLKNIWGWLSNHLPICLSQDSSSPWLEDIYADIRYQTVGLYIAYLDEYATGFVIVQVLPIRYQTGKQLFVQYAYGPGFGDEGADHLKDIAREVGARKIVFRSLGKGFERLAKRWGYKAIDRTYEYEVTDG